MCSRFVSAYFMRPQVQSKIVFVKKKKKKVAKAKKTVRLLSKNKFSRKHANCQWVWRILLRIFHCIWIRKQTEICCYSSFPESKVKRVTQEIKIPCKWLNKHRRRIQFFLTHESFSFHKLVTIGNIKTETCVHFCFPTDNNTERWNSSCKGTSQVV